MINKQIIIVLFLLISSCISLKKTHYNDLPVESKNLVKFKKINIKEHEEQERGMYSINSNELKGLLLENPKSLIIFHNSLCSGLNSKLEDFTDKLDKKIPFYFIAVGDWIEYFNYKRLLDYYPNLNKIYMLDNNEFGEVDHWHENGILHKKHKKMIEEVVPNYKNFFKKIKLESDPRYLIISNKLELKWHYNYFICDSANCDIEIDSVLNEIDKVIRN